MKSIHASLFYLCLDVSLHALYCGARSYIGCRSGARCNRCNFAFQSLHNFCSDARRLCIRVGCHLLHTTRDFFSSARSAHVSRCCQIGNTVLDFIMYGPCFSRGGLHKFPYSTCLIFDASYTRHCCRHCLFSQLRMTLRDRQAEGRRRPPRP